MVRCRACEGTDLKEVLDLGSMPSVGGFLPSMESFSDDPLYPLKIYVCRECCLVQITNPIDPDILFKNYSFSSSTVKPLVTHFSEYAQWIRCKFNNPSVFEFGCNDGILMNELKKLNIRSVGIDISENITEAARESGLEVLTGYFTIPDCERIIENYGKFDLVTGSNAFAHNDKPGLLLEAAKSILKDTGSLCLEVMYAGDLLEKSQWDTLYHEHLTFYSLKTLESLLAKYGFYVYDAMRIPMHGGSLRITASKDSGTPITSGYSSVRSYELTTQVNLPSTWMNFGLVVTNKINIVREVFESVSQSHSVAAYGAAGKAAMWFNSCNMSYLKYVVDESPLRAGKFMPGTHTPIVYPSYFKESPVDYVFVSAWNYAPVITKKENWFRGVWAVPLPELSFF